MERNDKHSRPFAQDTTIHITAETPKSPTNIYAHEGHLGKPVSTKTDEFPENFRKGGGGGSLPIQKNSLQFVLL